MTIHFKLWHWNDLLIFVTILFCAPLLLIVFLVEWSPSDQLLTVPQQISWLPAPRAQAYTSIHIYHNYTEGLFGNFLGLVFLLSTFLWDCSLCWDRWNGTWHLHLMHPCLVALGRVLIWVERRINSKAFTITVSSRIDKRTKPKVANCLSVCLSVCDKLSP